MSVFLDTNSMQVILDVWPTRRMRASPVSMFQMTIVQSSEALANLTRRKRTGQPRLRKMDVVLQLSLDQLRECTRGVAHLAGEDQDDGKWAKVAAKRMKRVCAFFQHAPRGVNAH